MSPKEAVGITLVKLSTVYLVIALVGGMYMAVSGDHVLATAHSHLALLGWTTMALTGLVYIALPRCATSPLAAAHFWLHNVGLPVMMVSLAFYAYGNAQAEMFLGLGSTVVLLALVVFAVNVFRNARPA